VSGPEFSPDFAANKLFDATVTEADLNTTTYGAEGQWAGPGAGPHAIFMDFGQIISTDGVAYAQRLGDDPLADKVGTIEFWFSDTTFGGTLPGRPADANVSITNTGDQVLTSYGLGGLFSGQHVAARFTAASLTPPANNPGGSEMRLILSIPEPSMLVLGGMAIIGLVLMTQRRSTQ
jgi:hypothetical protein